MIVEYKEKDESISNLKIKTFDKLKVSLEPEHEITLDLKCIIQFNHANASA